MSLLPTLEVEYIAHSKPIMKVCHIITSSMKNKLKFAPICSPTEHSALFSFQEKVHILWYCWLQILLNLAFASFSRLICCHVFFVVHEALVLPQGFTHTVLNIWNVPFIPSTSISFPWLICVSSLSFSSGITSLGCHFSPKLPILLHGFTFFFLMLLWHFMVTSQYIDYTF